MSKPKNLCLDCVNSKDYNCISDSPTYTSEMNGNSRSIIECDRFEFVVNIKDGLYELQDDQGVSNLFEFKDNKLISITAPDK